MTPDKNHPGAYVLHLSLSGPVKMQIRTLGDHVLAPGRYLYVGSARRGTAARCARHERLARMKTGKIRWHIDHLLIHPDCRLVLIDSLPGAEECVISGRIARQKRVVAPIPGFGSTDCRSGCPAHLYRLEGHRKAARSSCSPQKISGHGFTPIDARWRQKLFRSAFIRVDLYPFILFVPSPVDSGSRGRGRTGRRPHATCRRGSPITRGGSARTERP